MMKNPLLKVSAETRLHPLPLSGVVFLNDVVLVNQALDVIHHMEGRGDCLTKEAVGLWRSGLSRLLAAVIYVHEKGLQDSSKDWENNSVGLRRLAEGANARFRRMAILFEKMCATAVVSSRFLRFESATVEPLKVEIRALHEDCTIVDSVMPAGISLNG